MGHGKLISPVLLTTAISPPANFPLLKMTDASSRLIATKASVFFWALQGATRIVIADATGANVLTDDDIVDLNNMNVQVEQIKYQQNIDEIISRGKGYAEGKLLAFALANSAMIKSSKSFFKCTGKVYCRNFKSVIGLIETNNISSIFWRADNFQDDLVDTRFYYCEKKLFLEKIFPAYETSNDFLGPTGYAEACCYKAVHAHLRPVRAVRPLLSGHSGSTSEQYQELSFGDFDNMFPCWIETH